MEILPNGARSFDENDEDDCREVLKMALEHDGGVDLFKQMKNEQDVIFELLDLCRTRGFRSEADGIFRKSFGVGPPWHLIGDHIVTGTIQ